jgi:hypothetical protein
VDTLEGLFAVLGGPVAWIVQLDAAFAFSSSPCFVAGARQTTHGGVQPWPLIIGLVCLAISAASLWMGLLIFRRTRGESGGGKRHLLHTGQGRTRFLAAWGIAFAAVFTLLIVVNIALLLGMPVCEG